MPEAGDHEALLENLQYKVSVEHCAKENYDELNKMRKIMLQGKSEAIPVLDDRSPEGYFVF